MITPSVKRQGELMLHICGVNDMSVDKWMSFFKEDEVEWLLGCPEGKNICGRNPLSTQKVMDILQGNVPETPVVSSDDTSQQPIQSVRVSNERPIQRPSQAPVATIGHLPYMVETDKGEFCNVSQVMSRLEPLYNIDGFVEIFNQAMVDISVAPDIQYISTVKKKTLISKLKTLAKKALDERTEEI